jgi:hypothetical protein
MILIEKTEVVGWEPTIRGMRNPMNSWDKSDSGVCKGGDDGIGCLLCSEYDCGHEFDDAFHIGKNDHELMMKLAKGGPVHGKYLRMIDVYMDVTAPLYWWKEFDTYKVGTVANSCSTMHKIHAKEFELDDFSHEHLVELNCSPLRILESIVETLNFVRQAFLETGDKIYWWQMIQLLPTSYNQKRTIKLNYQVLANIYTSRREHKLDEWRDFCRWIERLPYSEIITLKEKI